MKIFYLFILMFQSLFSNKQEDRVENESVCVVFVCDENYFKKFQKTLSELRNEGKYSGDVVLIATGRLNQAYVKKRCRDKRLKITKFSPISVPEGVKNVALKPNGVTARMQKFHVFQRFFKQWDYVFYIDVGMHIHRDISKMVDLCEKGTLLAHSNCYPTYIWDHSHEFIDDNSLSYQHFIEEFGFTNDYFQSTMMLFDTKLIDGNTVQNLVDLLNKYPFGVGDQAYISLYFCHILPVWKQIKINEGDQYFYDFHLRVKEKCIMHKYDNGPEKCIDCK